MTQRKSIPKKTRFEIFKRDKFTCQYCGRSAPDVVLELDHIEPVAEGGDNDITNLVTSCHDCNSGKGKRRLSDDSAIKMQKNRLDELDDRREQLEMMYEWKRELLEFEKSGVDIASEKIASLSDFEPNDKGRQDLMKLISRFGLDVLIDSISISFGKYYDGNGDSWDEAFRKLGGICYNRTHKSCSQCINVESRSGSKYECDLVDGLHHGSIAEDCSGYKPAYGQTNE